MSLENRIIRLEAHARAAQGLQLCGFRVVADGAPLEPAPGAVLVEQRGNDRTWRLPDGTKERTRRL